MMKRVALALSCATVALALRPVPPPPRAVQSKAAKKVAAGMAAAVLAGASTLPLSSLALSADDYDAIYGMSATGSKGSSIKFEMPSFGGDDASDDGGDDASDDGDAPPPPPPPASPRATGDDDAKRVAATLAANGVPWVSVLEAGGFAKLVDLCAAGAGPRLRDLFPDFDDEAWRRRFDVPLVGGVRVPTSSFGETTPDLS